MDIKRTFFMIQPKVTIYSTPSCAYCYLIKDFLKLNNIKYSEIDVSKDKKTAARLKKEGHMTVPVTEIGEEFINGFDQDALKKALKIK